MADVTLPNGDIVTVPDGMSLDDVQKHMDRFRLESSLAGPAKPNPSDVIRDPGAKELGLSRDMEDRTWKSATAGKNTDKAASAGILQTLAGLAGGGLGGAATSGMAPSAAKGAITGLMGLAGDKAATTVTGQDPRLKLQDALSPLLGAAGGAIARSAGRNAVARSQGLVDALQSKDGTLQETSQLAGTKADSLDNVQKTLAEKLSYYLPNKNRTNIATSALKSQQATELDAAKKTTTVLDNLKNKHAEQLQDLVTDITTPHFPQAITNIPEGPKIASQLATKSLTSEDFANTLYNKGSRAVKVALSMVENHPQAEQLKTQIRQGYTENLIRKAFDPSTGKFIGTKIRKVLFDNANAKESLEALYPGDKNITQKFSELKEICEAGNLDSNKNLKQAFAATAKGLITAGTMAHFGHGGPAVAVAGGAAVAGASYVPWGKAIDALMRNDALRKSALELAKSGGVEQAGAGAGTLFKSYLAANAEPEKK